MVALKPCMEINTINSLAAFINRILISLFILSSLLRSQWSTDLSSPQNLGDGIQPQMAATSNGGVYIAWITDGDYHVYVQFMDELGIGQFGDSGLLISDNENASWIAIYHLNIVVDANDNAIISTVDQRTGSWEVYVWKIAIDGSMLWANEGLQITNSSTSNMSPRLEVMDDNSVVVTCSHNDGEILFQKISSEGDLLWGDGIIKQDDSKYLVSPQSVLDENGDIVFQWLRQSSGWPIYSEIFVQKYGINGDPLWEAPVLVVGPTSFPMGNFSQQLKPAYGGGICVAWTELAGNVQNAIVESITDEGMSMWGGGIDLSENSNNFRMSPVLVITENSHEVMAIWKEANGSQSQRGIFGQRIDSAGIKLWGQNGLELISMNSNYDYLDLSMSNFGDDVILTYLEQSSNMIGDIFSKGIDSSGSSMWNNDVVSITNSNTQKSDVCSVNGSNCVFISWSENGSIYAHCLRDDGTLGAPDIIPNVECDSGYVEIEGLCFSENDLGVLQNMIDNSYQSDIDLGCEDNDIYCGSPNPYMDDPDSWFWTIIDGQEFYFADGDNLVEPLELGLQTWENGRLKSILCGAYVYCQLSGPLPENINELTAIEDLRFEGNYLSGLIPETICQLNLDHEDNLSFDLSWNLLCPPYPECIEDHIGQQDTTDCVEVSILEEITPNDFRIYEPYPNPFNPFMKLNYELPEELFVEISIYDMVGNIIKILKNQIEEPGHRSVQWSGINNQGKPVSAGVYLISIKAGELRKTKKVVLLK